MAVRMYRDHAQRKRADQLEDQLEAELLAGATSTVATDAIEESARPDMRPAEDICAYAPSRVISTYHAFSSDCAPDTLLRHCARPCIVPGCPIAGDNQLLLGHLLSTHGDEFRDSVFSAGGFPTSADACSWASDVGLLMTTKLFWKEHASGGFTGRC
jgi:hypothetical protein